MTVTSNHPAGLLIFARAGHATATLDIKHEAYVAHRGYKAARGRKSEDKGKIKNDVTFGKYDYSWNGHSFIVYHASFMENETSHLDNLYILSKRPDSEVALTTETPEAVDELIIASTKWNAEVHDEILVFDQQRWTKDSELYRAVKSANWDDVVLNSHMKEALIKDDESFFGPRKELQALRGPLETRDNFFTGFARPPLPSPLHSVAAADGGGVKTPGNGKTISIKAVMNSTLRPSK